MQINTRVAGCTAISECLFPLPAVISSNDNDVNNIVSMANAPSLGLNERWECDKPNQNSTYPIMIRSYIATGSNLEQRDPLKMKLELP